MSVKVVGRAVATQRGYYPDDGVHCRVIEEGEEFDVVEGREKASWFTRVEVAVSKAPAGPKGKAKGPAADDIA